MVGSNPDEGGSRRVLSLQLSQTWIKLLVEYARLPLQESHFFHFGLVDMVASDGSLGAVTAHNMPTLGALGAGKF